MIDDLWLIGIGTGSEKHLTAEGAEAIRTASLVLVPHKGEGKDALSALRYRILETIGFAGEVARFDYPVRDAERPYLERVAAWHDEIARRWVGAVEKTEAIGPVALLVWGDPSLYDSTLRIAERLSPRPRIRVVPGITAIQALTAAHGIPLNTVGGSVHVTTGRRLHAEGWPTNVDTVVVMLDAGETFLSLDNPDTLIWWGAYLGSPDQILMSGRLGTVGSQISRMREEARLRHGWIMDTYLLRLRE